MMKLNKQLFALLPNRNIRQVNLTQFTNKYIAIIFYPADFDPTTVKEFNSIIELFKYFKKLDCQVNTTFNRHREDLCTEIA